MDSTASAGAGGSGSASSSGSGTTMPPLTISPIRQSYRLPRAVNARYGGYDPMMDPAVARALAAMRN